MFYEAREAAACDAVLRGYRAHLNASLDAGALLVCVVGAKLSEGINFGDHLGRCIVNFGLPYPDLRDTELRERLAHIERASAVAGAADCASQAGAAAARGSGAGVRTGGASGASMQHAGAATGELGPVGRDMYTNMCMQAVNQCVGRAIRHVGDYAAVVLVDARYTSADSGGAAVVGKLPHWLTQRWRDCPTAAGPAFAALTAFYKSMRVGNSAAS